PLGLASLGVKRKSPFGLTAIMSFSVPTVFDVAGAFTGVAASPAFMRTSGVVGTLFLSFANCANPVAEHGNAFVVIGVNFRKFAGSGVAQALPPSVNDANVMPPTTLATSARFEFRIQ